MRGNRSGSARGGERGKRESRRGDVSRMVRWSGAEQIGKSDTARGMRGRSEVSGEQGRMPLGGSGDRRSSERYKQPWAGSCSSVVWKSEER